MTFFAFMNDLETEYLKITGAPSREGELFHIGFAGVLS